MELYDDRGNLIAHQDAHGVELRTLEADVALRDAAAIVVHHRIESENLPDHLRSFELTFTTAPPPVPSEVQRAIDDAGPQQLDRSFFPTDGAIDDLGWNDDDELERSDDLVRERGRRRGSVLEERRRRLR